MIKRILRKLGFFPRDWVEGTTSHGGYTLVDCRSGRVLGHVYKFHGDQHWWAVAEEQPIGTYYEAYMARRAVERAT